MIWLEILAAAVRVQHVVRAHHAAVGSIVVIHHLDQHTAVCDRAVVDRSSQRLIGVSGFYQEGGIAAVHHRALFQDDGIAVLMRHEAEGVGMNGRHFVLGSFIDSGGFSGVVLQLIGLSRFQRRVGCAAAGKDGGVGTHVDFRSRECLHGSADHIGAVTGTVFFSVGIIQSFADLAAVRLKCGCCAFVSVVQHQAAVINIQVHIVARVRGQHGPRACGGLRVNDIGGSIPAHHIGAAGIAHDTQDPGRGYHQGLGGRVEVIAVQGATI